MSPREDRGLAIFKSSTITENEDGSFSVPSETDRTRVYTVRLFGTEWTCDCPDYVNRADQIQSCKHAFAVRFWIASKVELEAKPVPKVFAEDSTQCPKCGSIRVVRFGHANGKQVFKCRDCKTKFREGLLKKAHYSPETITLTLDLYFSGLSLRKITRTLNDHFDLSLGKSTVYRWIQNFVPAISEYVNSLSPKVSGTWHADELFVRMKGGHKRFIKGATSVTLGYLWNVMDRETRFLLASKLTNERTAEGGTLAFTEALKTAHGSKPQKVFTDALAGYPVAIAKVFGESRVNHIYRAGVRKHDANNNRIERMNGTLRERVKVQRGWKTVKTPLAEGMRIQYNFVKPHQGLDGKTPAQVAGVGIEAKNKWLAMLTEAITRDGTGAENTR